MKLFHNIRENIKLFVWDYIDIVQKILRYTSMFVSFFTVGVIAYYYGFKQTENSTFFCTTVIVCSLIFYVLKYLLLILYSKHSSEYIKQNKFQGILVLLIIIWFVSLFFFDIKLHNYLIFDFKFIDIENITILFIQLYFFIMMSFDFSSISSTFNKLKLGAGGWMITLFIILISIGTLLLMLPEMTVESIDFTNALFTSTSACCVTGLTVMETATAFTFKGQFIIMLLMQIGGINIVFFATYLASSYSGNSLHYQSIMKEMFNTNIHGTKSLVKEIFMYTLIIEAIGFIVIFLYYNHNRFYSESVSQTIFFSVFHTISSFNNAGFSIVEGGMATSLFQQDYFIQYTTIVLIFLGSIGFITMSDIFNNLRKKNNPKKWLWNRLQIMTKLSIKITLFLIAVGALSFFILEFNNTNLNASLSEKITSALFTSVSGRTAGFSIIDSASLSTPTILIFIILMFIGASPSSTGGGIKTTTFYIVIKAAIAIIQGKKQVTISNRSIPFSYVDRSYTVILFTLSLIFMGTLLVSMFEPQFSLEEIIFEVFSAVGTVGVSLGITPSLSIASKYVVMVLMFVGRITVLTLASSVVRKAMYTNYSLARTNISI